jgi:hypothetical protein
MPSSTRRTQARFIGLAMTEPTRTAIVRAHSGDRHAGATAAFPFDRAMVEKFRKTFPRARWRDDLQAWFVPGTTAERRLNRWLDRELSAVSLYDDERGRDAFAFEPIESPYLKAGEDLEIRTPYSRNVLAQLHGIPWASWEPEGKCWHVPFRSLDALRRRWPAIEAAARRAEPEERRKRRRMRGKARRRRRSTMPAPAKGGGDAIPCLPSRFPCSAKLS